MADIAVSVLLENLPRLVETAYGEYKLLSGVEGKINSLRQELELMDTFLKSSSDKRNSEFVQKVAKQIRGVAFKAEDIVEEYVSRVARYRDGNILYRLTHLPKQVYVLHGVDGEIETIKKHIEDIYANQERYGITQGLFPSEQLLVLPTAESLLERRRDVEEKDVVGLEDERAQVMEKLMEGGSGRKVVCIIGMGGLGKTTLARKIYNHGRVEFPTRAWGNVSNDYRPREFLLSLLKCLLPSCDYDDLLKKKEGEDEAIAASEEKLKLRLGERLKGNKYLVVLDDIWETHVWDKIQDAFPDDDDSFGRIVITSREMDVANYAGTTSPYPLRFLSEQESWELFCKKVFRGKECPSDLEPLGRSIAESCKGLPLTIVVLAGFVAKKERSQREWENIKNITWHLNGDKNEAVNILKLSYDNLPERLKPCFLYFGIYPEDYEIEAKDVIQMWIAEGFIQADEAGIQTEAAAEDIAEYYLDELVSRSLVQVGKRRSDGGVKTCRIHDLLRDLCIEESKSCEFMEVCTELDKSSNLRRLSVHCREELKVSTNSLKQLKPRSFFLFSEGEKTFPADTAKAFKSARLLYCKTGRAESRRIPSVLLRIEWKTMIHIRYLKIDVFVDIPASVSRLWNLETLDVEWAGKVSSKIWMLKRLKHLYLRNAACKVLPKSDRKIKANLETLHLRSGDEWDKMMLVLKNVAFSKLRKLVWQPYSPVKGWEEKEKCGLEHLSNLQHLKLKLSYPDLLISSCPMQFPSNIRKITLERVVIGWGMNNLTQVLARLTNLQILKLRRLKEGEDHQLFELSFGGGDFPRLQVFQMKLLGVKSWTVEKGAMPSLRHLVIHDCRYLEELPEQLWSTLRQVHVTNPSKELAQSLQSVELKNACQLTISYMD